MRTMDTLIIRSIKGQYMKEKEILTHSYWNEVKVIIHRHSK